MQYYINHDDDSVKNSEKYLQVRCTSFSRALW